MATTLDVPPVDPAGRPRPLAPGWVARLRLRYARRGPATRVVERWHQGPLVVQKALYPEADPTCHTVLIHPPGGIVGGDQLHVRLEVDADAHALVTTPAASKLYRSAGATSRIDQRLSIADGAILEWLPQETIAFDASRATMRTSVRLEPAATFIGWEMLALGRPAASAPFASGALEQRLDVERAGVPMLRERLRLDGESTALVAPWGLAGHRVVGTLVALGPAPLPDVLVGSVRDALARGSTCAGATMTSGMLLVRVLADQPREAMAALVTAWSLIRPTLVGPAAQPPRIWST